MCGLQLWSIGFPFPSLYLECLRLSERQYSVLVGVGLRVAFENLLKVRIGLGGWFGRTAEHGRKE